MVLGTGCAPGEPSDPLADTSTTTRVVLLRRRLQEFIYLKSPG